MELWPSDWNDDDAVCIKSSSRWHSRRWDMDIALIPLIKKRPWADRYPQTPSLTQTLPRLQWALIQGLYVYIEFMASYSIRCYNISSPCGAPSPSLLRRASIPSPSGSGIFLLTNKTRSACSNPYTDPSVHQPGM